MGTFLGGETGKSISSSVVDPRAAAAAAARAAAPAYTQAYSTPATNVSSLHAQTAPAFGGPTYTTAYTQANITDGGSKPASTSTTGSGGRGTTSSSSVDYASDIAALQRMLNDVMGTALDVDGIFGPKTQAATAALQRKLNDAGASLDVDGVWGPLTQAAYDTYKNKTAGAAVSGAATAAKSTTANSTPSTPAAASGAATAAATTASNASNPSGSGSNSSSSSSSNYSYGSGSGSGSSPSNAAPNYQQMDPNQLPALADGYAPYDIESLLQAYFGTSAGFNEPALENLAMGDRYDLMYDYDKILEILDNATKNKYNELWNEYSQTENAYYNQNLADQAATLDNIRRAQAQATMSGASAGMQAANMLTSIMSGQQNNAGNQLELANQRNNTALQEQTELAANKNTALETSNAVKQAIAGLDDTVYGYRTQDHIGHMDYDAAVKAALGQIFSGIPSANAQAAAAKIQADANMYNSILNYNGTLANAQYNYAGR